MKALLFLGEKEILNGQNTLSVLSHKDQFDAPNQFTTNHKDFDFVSNSQEEILAQSTTRDELSTP